MMSMRDDVYRKLVMRLLQHSNSIAIVMIMIAFYVCFTQNNWLYILILTISSIYLGWLTFQHISSESEKCEWQIRHLQYDCQIASFNNRLSITSNVFIAMFGVAFSILLIQFMLKSGDLLTQPSETNHIVYMLGFLKLLIIYIISDKIHTSQVIIAMLMNRSQNVKHLTIDIDKDKPKLRYPLIYVDGQKISDSRYEVTVDEALIEVTFTPPISLEEGSVIQYFLIEDDNCVHIITKSDLCSDVDRLSCLFRCRAPIRRLDTLPADQ
mgnify:CR=1 FL=1